MSADAIETLQQFFGVDEEQALTLLELSQWVDQEMALEVHGYPKDNLIPRPMHLRLQDRNYLGRLLDAARDQEPLLADTIATAIYGEELSRRRTLRLHRPSDKDQ